VAPVKVRLLDRITRCSVSGGQHAPLAVAAARRIAHGRAVRCEAFPSVTPRLARDRPVRACGEQARRSGRLASTPALSALSPLAVLGAETGLKLGARGGHDWRAVLVDLSLNPRCSRPEGAREGASSAQ